MKSKQNLSISITVILLLLFGISVSAQSDIKVACVGNSITQGIGTVPFPEQLDVLLGTGWEAVNFGLHSRTLLRQGDYPYWETTQFTDAMNFLPDKVIIMLGTNDSKPYNWVFGDEFYTDYLALVDTFAQLESSPEIWVCYPLKAFSGMYDIQDSVIFNCIIPLIDSVVKYRDVELIDMYSLTEGKPEYFSDGIHPTTHGNNYIAKALFETLVDSNIVAVVDTNALLNKPLSSGTADETLPYLNDGDLGSEWISQGLPAWAIIDLGEPKLLDAFQLVFSTDVAKGYQYTIEGSLNSTDWTMLVDQSGREDTINYTSADTILPSSWQYIRLTIPSFYNSSADVIRLPEFKSLISTGYKHAPVIYTKRTTERQLYTYYVPLFAGGAIAYYGDSATSAYIPMLNFYDNSSGATRYSNLYGDLGESFVFYSESFYNGIQVNSDMTYYTFHEIVNSVDASNSEEHIFSAYPNPFSGEVLFSYQPGINGSIDIKIYNCKGQLIKIVYPADSSNGYLTWDGTNLNSHRVPAGIYHCILEYSMTPVQTISIILLNE
jgi:hypothetical protein